MRDSWQVLGALASDVCLLEGRRSGCWVGLDGEGSSGEKDEPFEYIQTCRRVEHTSIYLIAEIDQHFVVDRPSFGVRAEVMET
jgi:hypothetical protein